MSCRFHVGNTESERQHSVGVGGELGYGGHIKAAQGRALYRDISFEALSNNVKCGSGPAAFREEIDAWRQHPVGSRFLIHHTVIILEGKLYGVDGGDGCRGGNSKISLQLVIGIGNHSFGRAISGAGVVGHSHCEAGPVVVLGRKAFPDGQCLGPYPAAVRVNFYAPAGYVD